MDRILLAGILGLVAVILFIVLILMLRKKRKGMGEAQTEYIAGLNYLISGDKELALKKFRETVRLDTEFIDAYIKIGDILRDLGAADQAVKVHRDLLVRSHLTPKDRLAILKSLALDYKAISQYEKALMYCEQILEIDKNNEWAKSLQLEIYEQMGDWAGAYEVVKKSNRFSKEEKKKRLAKYKIEQGRQLVELGRERDARVQFREAIKLDPECVAGYLELADSYMREKREKDALSTLDKFIKQNPKSSGLAFNRLKKVLFDLGLFSDIEKIYLQLAREHPDVAEANLGLAEIYEKKGELLKAVDACHRALEIDPDRVDVKLLLLRLQSKLGRDDVASEITAELVADLMKQYPEYSHYAP